MFQSHPDYSAKSSTAQHFILVVNPVSLFFFKLTANFGLFLGKLKANKGCQGTSPTWLNDVVWFLMWEDNRGTFSLEEALLWIMDSYFDKKRRFKVKNVIKLRICFIQTCSFSLQDIHCWTGVVWITCGLLWCFYEQFGLLFWRHPFTAEDPLVSKWCNAKFLQICSDEETNSSTSWMA